MKHDARKLSVGFLPVLFCATLPVDASTVVQFKVGADKVQGLKLGRPDDRPFELDFRYAPPDWQTSICLPDDWQKTLVGRDGTLLYDYAGQDFATRIRLSLGDGEQWLGQELENPRTPITVTRSQRDGITLTVRAFAVPDPTAWPAPPTQRFMAASAPDPDELISGEATAPARADLPSGSAAAPAASQPPRADLLLATVTNTRDSTAQARPVLTVHSGKAVRFEAAGSTVWIGRRPMVRVPAGSTPATSSPAVLTISLPTLELAPGESRQVVIPCHHNADAQAWSNDAAANAVEAARRFWAECKLPYDRVRIPDPNLQALFDASIRNIYQAREIKDGLPAFQVGPTCYRGLWIVDGAFLLEAITLLNRPEETRAGVQYMLNHQNADGSFELLEQYWKETGIVLWVIDRHEQLTGDRQWLDENWPRVERAVTFVQKLRRDASRDPNALHAGLVPPGFPDGGLGGPMSEYTNVYWLLTGLKSAVGMAQRTGRTRQAADWQREFDAMWATFRKAAERDLYTDSFGNRMLPVPMARPLEKAPHKALWAFCHAIYPGELFAPDDPLMLGTLASLTDNECEGLVKGTGWLDAGLWNYFASFYGHAFAWLGQGGKAAEVLYAFGNHATPLFAWREEHMPKGQPHAICGDMPHNWASAEFIRLAVHLLVLERGDELHLLEGLPSAWLRPGAQVAVDQVVTRAGPISFSFRVSDDGRTADLHIRTPARNPMTPIVIHIGEWAHAPVIDGKPFSGSRRLVAEAEEVHFKLELVGKP